MAAEVEEQVERTVDLPVDVDEAWRLVTDADELERWLGDEVELTPEPAAPIRVTEDGWERRGVVDDVDPGRRLAFRWWPADDDSQETRVEITVSPLDSGARIVVVESALLPVGPQATAFALLGGWAWERRAARFAVGLVC